MLLMIDNYDSFTYNLVQYFGELGEDVHVYRNDKLTVQEIEDLKPSRIVISPGPCTPKEAGSRWRPFDILQGVFRCSASVSAINLWPWHSAGQWFGRSD